MARTGASKSLDQRTPKARGASEAVAPVPAKAAGKTTRTKAAEPRAAARSAAPSAPAKSPAKATKATKVAKVVKAVKAMKALKSVKSVNPVKAAKAVKAAPVKASPAKAPPVKAAPAKAPVKAAPAKAAPVKAAAKGAPPRAAATAKSAPTPGSTPTKRNSEVAPVAEAPKGKRPAATKAPAKAAPAATPAKAEVSAAFPPKTLDKLRRLLEEERETYVRQARDLAAEAEALASEREPGDTQFDEESGEGDTLNVERERDLALSASATQAVEEIDRALHRMDAGGYGICERCGKKIAVARLEALPFAALCIECKSREERRR